MNQTPVQSSRPVLIIGGGGFLGTNLTDHLVSRGQPVINISRSWLTRQDNPLVRYIPYSPGDNAGLHDLISRSACVFHMAHGSSPATSLQGIEQDLIASMQLTFALISACAGAGVPLIYLSSGGAVYGKDVPVPTPETARTRPISPYGVSKLTAEHYLYLGQLHRDLDYRALRISNPYGPWQLGHHGQGVIGTWMRRILNGQKIELWGDGTVVRDYIHVSDVVDSMVRVMGYAGPERVFNIGSGQGQSLNDLLDHLRPICNDPLNVTYRPAAPADVPVSILDTGLARAALNWQPSIDLTNGLRQTWDWMQSQSK